jgi:hypothetical protein
MTLSDLLTHLISSNSSCYYACGKSVVLLRGGGVSADGKPARGCTTILTDSVRNQTGVKF